MSKFVGLMTGGGPVAREDVDLIVEKLLLQQEVIIHGWRREIERADDLESENQVLRRRVVELEMEADRRGGVFRPEPEEAAS